MFFGNGFRIGSIGGITIRVDFSWFIIFALFVFMLASVVFPTFAPGIPASGYWLTAFITTILFFGSVLAHELSHALVARRSGIPINTITLFIFGGVAQMEDEPHTPWDEFKMAIAGPIASVLIGVLFLGISFATRGFNSRLIAASLTYLALINIVLAVFNLLPGFPLDGGRVFRAMIWGITKNLRKATYIASITGQIFGWIFIILGVGSLFYRPLANYVNLWMALIGWFLVMAARNSYQQLLVRETLQHVPITELMNPQVEAVPGELSVERLVTDYFLRESPSTLPVERNGTLIGTISVDDVRKLPREQWVSTMVSEIAQPVSEAQVLHADNDAWDAANQISKTNQDGVLVTEGGHVEGIVTRGAIARWLQTHTRLAPGSA
ncbi:MAG: M50 family metallopeptidase [Armatimonadota bacterium]